MGLSPSSFIYMLNMEEGRGGFLVEEVGENKQEVKGWEGNCELFRESEKEDEEAAHPSFLTHNCVHLTLHPLSHLLHVPSPLHSPSLLDC